MIWQILDMDEARTLLASQQKFCPIDKGYHDLDLGNYSHYEQVAIEYLVDGLNETSEICQLHAGFRNIDAECILALTKLPLDYFRLSKLISINEDTAWILGKWDWMWRPILNVNTQTALTANAASCLVSAMVSASLAVKNIHAPTLYFPFHRSLLM